MTAPVRRAPYVLSWMTAAMAAVVSAAGLAAPGLYAADPAWIRATWFGNDLVTLMVAVPLLAAGLIGARRGSNVAVLVWYAMLAYCVYNYAYYLHGASINALFPAFAAVMVTAAFALAMALFATDVRALAGSFSAWTPARPVAVYLGVSGIGLGMAWIAQWAALVFGGVEPAIGEGPFQLVASLDLTFIVPLLVVSSVLLWRRMPWGFLWGAVMALKGATYTLVLTVNSTIATLRGIEGFASEIPVWGAWTAVGLAASVALLAGARRRRSPVSTEGE